MTQTDNPERQVLILADESAGWRVAGLAQLERLVLAANDWARDGIETSITIFWQPDCQSSADVQSVRSFLPLNVITSGAEVTGEVFLFSTHLCPFPGEMNGMAQAFSVPVLSPQDWFGLFQLYSSRAEASAGSAVNWRSLSDPRDIPAIEIELLRRMTKPQDGLVSRRLNRPISRLVTRQLLQLPISPNAWTFAILILPIIAFFFLLDGRYGAVIAGCVLFQLFSILDGCDGEMARAKYLESPTGALVDHLCDQIGNVLFLFGLGLGLYRTSFWGDRLFLESVFCAIALILQEMLLWRWKEQHVPHANMVGSAYRRHQGMIEHSGIQILGRKGVSVLFQLTKRDVAVLVFLLLAIVGLPQWILHLWTAVTLGSLFLTLFALVRSAGNRTT